MATASNVVDTTAAGYTVGEAIINTKRGVMIGSLSGHSSTTPSGTAPTSLERYVLIGYGASALTGMTNIVAIGDQAYADEDNSFNIGGHYQYMPRLYLGAGGGSYAGGTATFSASGNKSNNGRGGNAQFSGGYSRGYGAGGYSALSVSQPGGSASAKNWPSNAFLVLPETNTISMAAGGIFDEMTGTYVNDGTGVFVKSAGNYITNNGSYWEARLTGAIAFTNAALIGGGWGDYADTGATNVTTWGWTANATFYGNQTTTRTNTSAYFAGDATGLTNMSWTGLLITNSPTASVTNAIVPTGDRYKWAIVTGGGVGGGATNLTPWTSDINGDGYSLTNAGPSTFQAPLDVIQVVGNETYLRLTDTNQDVQVSVGSDGHVTLNQKLTVHGVAHFANPIYAGAVTLTNGDLILKTGDAVVGGVLYATNGAVLGTNSFVIDADGNSLLRGAATLSQSNSAGDTRTFYLDGSGNVTVTGDILTSGHVDATHYVASPGEIVEPQFFSRANTNQTSAVFLAQNNSGSQTFLMIGPAGGLSVGASNAPGNGNIEFTGTITGNGGGLSNSVDIIAGANVTITTNADNRSFTVAATGGGGISTPTNVMTLYAVNNQVNIPVDFTNLLYRLTLTNNFTITNATGMQDGQSFDLEVDQDSTGNRTLSWWGGFTNAIGYSTNSFSANLTGVYLGTNALSRTSYKWRYRADTSTWMLRANDWGN